jgi:hypothetical protein
MQQNDERNFPEDMKTLATLILQFKDRIESLHPLCSAFIPVLPKLIDTTIPNVNGD